MAVTGRSGPLVSVVIPMEDAARFVEGAVGPVLAQTHENPALTGVGEGSTGRSVTIVEGLARRDGHLSRSANRGRGISDAFNTGPARGGGNSPAGALVLRLVRQSRRSAGARVPA